jgi:hypothetical protein
VLSTAHPARHPYSPAWYSMLSHTPVTPLLSPWITLWHSRGSDPDIPMSSILLNNYVDDPLNVLHRVGHLHGIPSVDCQDKLDSQASANDTDALSSSKWRLTTPDNHCKSSTVEECTVLMYAWMHPAKAESQNEWYMFTEVRNSANRVPLNTSVCPFLWG